MENRVGRHVLLAQPTERSRTGPAEGDEWPLSLCESPTSAPRSAFCSPLPEGIPSAQRDER